MNSFIFGANNYYLSKGLNHKIKPKLLGCLQNLTVVITEFFWGGNPAMDLHPGVEILLVASY